MDAIAISAASGMRARMQSLEMLANNLANTETGGFKADREFYSLYIGDDATSDLVTGDTQALPVIESQWIDHAQGNLRETANPLDFAIEGEGLFAVQTPSGPRYTRNGSFRVSQAGYLIATDGNAVRGQGGAQILLQPGLPVQVASDGTVTQEGQTAGQMEFVSFDRESLEKTGLNYFTAAPNARPRPATGAILQGKVEQSNVGAAESAVRLVAIMRQFEMLQKAMNIGSDLNKHAIEEVARVNP